MRVFGSKELLDDVIGGDWCIGCGMCVDLCPYFKNHRGRTAMLFPCTRTQGRCQAYCPKTELDLSELAMAGTGRPYEGSALGNMRGIYQARAGRALGSGPYQSGGTVTGLVTHAFKAGIIDAAALTDREGMVPVPRLITSAEEVRQCAGSKSVRPPQPWPR